jgi:hypothetical protein
MTSTIPATATVPMLAIFLVVHAEISSDIRGFFQHPPSYAPFFFFGEGCGKSPFLLFWASTKKEEMGLPTT